VLKIKLLMLFMCLCSVFNKTNHVYIHKSTVFPAQNCSEPKTRFEIVTNDLVTNQINV